MKNTRLMLLFCGFVVAGCADRVDVDNIPVGSEIQLTRADGGLVEGTLTARDDTKVKVDVGRTTRDVARVEGRCRRGE